MRRRTMLATAVVVALAVAAPAASAQTGPFDATYNEHFIAPQGNSNCPDDAFGCGSGTAAGLGAFTIQRTFEEDCGCVVQTLTFADGNTLTLDEDFLSFTEPGQSASSHAPGSSEGHPGTSVHSWTVAGGTGPLAGATGSGTDELTTAGLIGTGALAGTITAR
jgi:hypothetical protein